MSDPVTWFQCVKLHNQIYKHQVIKSLLVCAVQGTEEDVEMADAPDEYLDPITYTVMQDPVKLPSGAVMDRPNVMRMLLSDPRDPTTRSVPHTSLAIVLCSECVP